MTVWNYQPTEIFLNYDPTLSWTELGNISDSFSNVSIKIDDKDNIYLVGDSDTKVLVAKFSIDENLEWSQLFGPEISYGPNYSNFDVSLDGSVYVVGSTDGSFNDQEVLSENDGFITKLSSEGVEEWTKFINEANQQQLSDVKISSDGYIYVSGQEMKKNIYFNQTFVIKFDSSGNQIWKKIIPNTLEDVIKNEVSIGLTLDNEGKIYLLSNANFSNTSKNSFQISTLDKDGNLLSNFSTLGSNPNSIGGILTNIDGDIYTFAQSLEKSSSIVPYTVSDATSTNGGFLYNLTDNWSKYNGGSSNGNVPNSFTFNDNGNIFIVGQTTTDLNTIELSSSYPEGFVIKYDQSGNKQWTELISVENQFTSIGGVATNSKGEIYFSSYSDGAIVGKLTDRDSGTVDENIAPGSVVGTLMTKDLNNGDFHSFTLLNDSEGIDNSFFSIDNNKLIINTSPDFESKSSYIIKVQTKDANVWRNLYYPLVEDKYFAQVLEIQVNDLSEAKPIDINISSTSFNENIDAASTVATLSTTDADSGDSHTYRLVSGTGDTDNDAFTIDESDLKISSSPNYETKSSYSVRIKTTDSGGLSYEEAITLSVNDLLDTAKIADIKANYTPHSKGFSSISGAAPVTVIAYEVGTETTLDSIKDYGGNLHAGDNLQNTSSSYKYQGLLDVNGDGVFEGIFTNKVSKRWVTVKVDSTTGQVDFDDNGAGGGTRVVGIYEDPLIAEGASNGGFLADGVTPAPANFGVSEEERYLEVNGETIDRLALNSQVRFQNDLDIDNLSAKHSGDYDGDGIHEVYWKTNDGTAYLRALMHDDGNIRYANYQNQVQMSSYLTGEGHSEIISEIL